LAKTEEGGGDAGGGNHLGCAVVLRRERNERGARQEDAEQMLWRIRWLAKLAIMYKFGILVLK